MQRYITHRNGFWLLLIASLAFNAGFGTTFGVRTFGHRLHEGEQGKHRGHRGLHDRLNLSPQQRTEIEASGERLFGHMDEHRRELRLEQQTLADLITVAQPDDAALADQLEKVGTLRNKIQEGVVAHFLEVKEFLDAEQLEVFNEMIRRHIFHHDGSGKGRGARRRSGPQHREGRGSQREHGG